MSCWHRLSQSSCENVVKKSLQYLSTFRILKSPRFSTLDIVLELPTLKQWYLNPDDRKEVLKQNNLMRQP